MGNTICCAATNRFVEVSPRLEQDGDEDFQKLQRRGILLQRLRNKKTTIIMVEDSSLKKNNANNIGSKF